MISLTLPLRTPNPLNGSHGHWSKKAKMRKAHRNAMSAMLTREMGERDPYPAMTALANFPPPTAKLAARLRAMASRTNCLLYLLRPGCIATVTRIAPSRGLDPHDGLGAALKGVIDGVADALGVDDRDPRVTWELRQERGPWGVRVEVRAR